MNGDRNRTTFNLARDCPRLCVALLGVWVLTATMAAQNRLYVLEPDGNYHAVVRMHKDRACFADRNEVKEAHGSRFALRKVEEYLPALVAVTDKDAGASSLVPVTTGPIAPLKLNHEFHFGARFEAAAKLEDVFLVLALETTEGGRRLFAYEIGGLEPSKPKAVAVSVPLEEEMGAGRYELMVFAGGAEVFTTEMAAANRDAILARMAAQRMAGVKQAGPRPFFCPAPRYPEALRPAGLQGVVVVAMSISPEGVITDPVIESSPEPAFSAAILAVLPQWRFLPRVVEGKAVESRVKLPVAFSPPVG